MDALYKFSAFAGTIPRRVRYAEGGAYAPVRSTDRRVARSSPTRREYFVCNHRPAGARPAIAYAGQYVNPAGLWSMGLGIVIGWDKSHGWSVGLGAASEFGGSKGSSFNTSYTWNQDGSNSFSLGASGSVQLAYFPIAMNFGGGYSYNSYSGHTLSTQTGACFGYQDAVCSGNEVGGSLYWDNHGSFMGATAFAENYVEVAGGMFRFSNGYEKGFMGMEGRGLYAGGNVGGLYAEYSQNGGWNYGGRGLLQLWQYDGNTNPSGLSKDKLEKAEQMQRDLDFDHEVYASDLDDPIVVPRGSDPEIVLEHYAEAKIILHLHNFGHALFPTTFDGEYAFYGQGQTAQNKKWLMMNTMTKRIMWYKGNRNDNKGTPNENAFSKPRPTIIETWNIDDSVGWRFKPCWIWKI